MILTVAEILLAALLLDACIGDPKKIYRHIPHPVTLMAAVLSFFEKKMNRGSGRKIKGTICIFLYLSFLTAAAFFIEDYASSFLMIILVSLFLASRSLIDHVLAVRGDHMRSELAKIVGRDVTKLDSHGMRRAAIESLAENFSDGIIAPCFWYLIAGFPGIICYKAINTADSMIGYKNSRFLKFGWAAARIDDLANYIPARLSVLLIALAAACYPKAHGGKALQMAFKYAALHKSPNAGCPEAAVAGAVSLCLGGPRYYEAQQINGAWLGEGRKNAEESDLLIAVHIIIIALIWGCLMLGAFSLGSRII